MQIYIYIYRPQKKESIDMAVNETRTIRVSKELKKEMDKRIKEIGIDMSYSALIKYLLKKDK